MKQVIVLSLLSMSMLSFNSRPINADVNLNKSNYVADPLEAKTLNFSPEQSEFKMLAVVFRAQEYCRAEVPDFDFATQFKVVSAKVYFTGPNFRGVESGTITSNSLKPLKSLMDRCSPGTMVIFDNVKVFGPDNLTRTILGTSFMLH